jgi:hypothetical protein
VFLRSNSAATIWGLEMAIPGTHLLMEGGGSKVFGCIFEQYEKQTNNVPIIVIRDGGWPMSGNNNTVRDCTLVPHEWGTQGAHIEVGSGCYTNLLDLVIVAQNPSVRDNGIGTIKNIRS